jgi:hypothetical protein
VKRAHKQRAAEELTPLYETPKKQRIKSPVTPPSVGYAFYDVHGPCLCTLTPYTGGPIDCAPAATPAAWTRPCAAASPHCRQVTEPQGHALRDGRGQRLGMRPFPELHECPVGQEHAVPALLLSPHRPYRAESWAVARIRQGLPVEDPEHLSRLPEFW